MKHRSLSDIWEKWTSLFSLGSFSFLIQSCVPHRPKVEKEISRADLSFSFLVSHLGQKGASTSTILASETPEVMRQ